LKHFYPNTFFAGGKEFEVKLLKRKKICQRLINQACDFGGQQFFFTFLKRRGKKVENIEKSTFLTSGFT